jgi:uncharacterized protein CbrC (UPF0167 family)
MTTLTFRYFPDWESKAAISKEECNCTDDLPCLEPIFFEDPDIETPVCVVDLSRGDVRVAIPDHLIETLDVSIRKYFPDLELTARTMKVKQLVDVLSRTPPVPWIQHNAWPVSMGDFCRYIGEWDQHEFDVHSQNKEGKSFLWSILEEYCRNRRQSVESLWDEMEVGKSTVYVFECLTSGRLIAVDQSY